MTFTRRLGLLLLVVAVPAYAAGDADDGALSLADSTPESARPASGDWRVFTELSLGQVTLRQGAAASATANTRRFSVDLLMDKKLSPALRAVLSNRLDLSRQADDAGVHSDTINTLKEAYLSWQPQNDRVVGVGRINVRYGVAQGYNPTDFLREGANRSIVSVDPSSIRENRLGTAMLRGQTLWAGGSITALLAPKLADVPNNGAWSPDLGSTNNRTRWMLAASHQLSERWNPQVIVFGDAHQSVQLGLNLATLINDATVAHFEWSGGRMQSLAAQALPPNSGTSEDVAFRNRVATGFTFTSANKVSLTAEYHYNGAAPDQAGWNALRAGSPADYGRYRLQVQDRLELTTRHAGYLRATWQDAFVNKLDLSAMVRVNADDRSRLAWVEARYRWVRAELALQWQRNSGDATSEYGALPQRSNAQAQLRYFFD